MKSPPELWSELSEVESLARHLGALGEIRITKVEPETTVAWEGEQISGTVALEQSGWGTKVTFTAAVPEPDSPIAADPGAPDATEASGADDADPGTTATADPGTTATADPGGTATADPGTPEATADPEPEAPRRGFWARLFRRRPAEVPETAPTPEPATSPPEAVAPEPEATAVAAEPAAEPEPSPDNGVPEAEAVLRVFDDTLDALGQAHHRPFSRG